MVHHVVMPHALSPDAARNLQLADNPLVERTRRECARDPVAAATRQALIKMERDLHRGGWNVLNTPQVFRVDRHRLQNRVWIEPEPDITAALREQITHHKGHFGRALRERAELAELIRSGGALADGTVLPPWPDGDAVVPEDPNRVFYGYGMCAEAWFADSTENKADEKALDAFARDHALDKYPGSVDARSVYLVCRDGRKWDCGRVRGAAPRVYCWTSPDEKGAHVGLVFHALSRLTNAVADNPVFIVPSDEMVSA